MLTQNQRRVCAVASALCGAALGVALGVVLGRAVILHTASRRVAEYAKDLNSYSFRYATEVSGVFDSLRMLDAPSCSTANINAMQRIVFRSLQVKDIGLVQDGKVYCSAGVGLLSNPYPLPAAYMPLANNGNFYTEAQLAENSVRGSVLLYGGVAILISPNAFDYWARPHMNYAVYLVNPAIHRIEPMSGSAIPVLSTCAPTPDLLQAGTHIYGSKYSDNLKVCVITSESIVDALADNEQLLQGYGVLGILMGLAAGIAGSIFILRRGGLVQQLRRAIHKRTLHLVYQPVYDLATRSVVGAEALVRWNHPERGPIAPPVFVRLAEDFGFMHLLTEYVLQTAVVELAPMLRDHPHFCVSINLAASDLGCESLYKQLNQLVRSNGIHPGQVALELTEGSTADLTTTHQLIERLHQMGHPFYIDDFGTGFSSLAYLQQLCADVIKIDRAFVRSCGTDAVTASILPQMLSMAESMGLGVIVEGVETEPQLQFLERCGKPLRVQGFIFSRPISAFAIQAMVLDQDRKVPQKFVVPAQLFQMPHR